MDYSVVVYGTLKPTGYAVQETTAAGTIVRTVARCESERDARMIARALNTIERN